MDSQSRLGQFLVDLTTDSDRMALFESSPSEAQRLMDEAGLTAEEQRAVTSRNVEAVSGELSRDAAKKKTNGNGPVLPGKPGKPKPPGQKKKKKPAPKRGPAKRGPAKRAPAKRAPAKRGGVKRAAGKRGATTRRAGTAAAPRRGIKRGSTRKRSTR